MATEAAPCQATGPSPEVAIAAPDEGNVLGGRWAAPLKSPAPPHVRRHGRNAAADPAGPVRTPQRSRDATRAVAWSRHHRPGDVTLGCPDLPDVARAAEASQGRNTGPRRHGVAGLEKEKPPEAFASGGLITREARARRGPLTESPTPSNCPRAEAAARSRRARIACFRCASCGWRGPGSCSCLLHSVDAARRAPRKVAHYTRDFARVKGFFRARRRCLRVR